MEAIRKNQHLDAVLYDFLFKYRITHRDVDLCKLLHMGEISNTMNIPDHKTLVDQQLFAKLLGLLAGDQCERVMDFYSMEHNFLVDKNISREDEVLLFTACLEYPAFFSFALSVCEDIELELHKPVMREGEAKPYTIEKIKVNGKSCPSYTFGMPVHKRAADGEDKDLTIFLEQTITYKDSSGIEKDLGTLKIKTNNQNKARFEFSYKKFWYRIPYELELRFTTKNDKKECTIDILADPKFCDQNREENITIMKTDYISDIDFAKGFLEGWKIILIPTNN